MTRPAPSTALRLAFAGTPDFAVPTLRALLGSRHDIVAVYTQPDRPAGRGRKPRPSPVKACALEHGIEVRQPATLRDPETQQELRELALDTLVVVAYGLILPEAVLAAPRLGCLNVHASLLPRWRGAAPIQRALLAGDAETGITIMQMDRGLDTGPMLDRSAIALGNHETSATLHDRLAELGAERLLVTLDALADGHTDAEPQDSMQATYAAKLSKAEAVLDWRQSAVQLARQVHALNPWPVAETRLHGETLRVWAAQPLAGAGDAPGRIVHSGPEGIDVACGEGLLRLQRVQLPGRKPIAAADLRNARDVNGANLG